MFRVNNKDSGIFIVNFEHISHLALVFLLLSFEPGNAGWITTKTCAKKMSSFIKKLQYHI